MSDLVEIERLAGREMATWALWLQIVGGVGSLVALSLAAWVGLHRRQLGNALIVGVLLVVGWVVPALYIDRVEIGADGVKQRDWSGFGLSEHHVPLTGYSSLMWARDGEGAEALLFLDDPFRAGSGAELERFVLGGVLDQRVAERIVERAREAGIAVIDNR